MELRKVLMCGSRHWRCRRLVATVLQAERAATADHSGARRLLVIHGGYTGADTTVDEVAGWLSIHTCRIRALWERWNRAAGPRRNQMMLDAHPDIEKVVAFHDDYERSFGTKDMVNRAKGKGIETYLVRHDPRIPCNHQWSADED